MIRNTFENYLNEPYTLSFEQMQNLHRELLEEIEANHEACELYSDLVRIVTKYAVMRAEWQQMTREEKMDQDSLRTSYHDSVIVHFNMLARYLRMQGKKAQWRDLLGYEEDHKYGRKTIGDFGCYLVFVNSICSR